jgi:predicted nucleotidyltransferase
MILNPSFPTKLHQDSAELINDYFLAICSVDTPFLVVNSCARGQAIPESDLDFAILIKPDTKPAEIRNIQKLLGNLFTRAANSYKIQTIKQVRASAFRYNRWKLCTYKNKGR